MLLQISIFNVGVKSFLLKLWFNTKSKKLNLNNVWEGGEILLSETIQSIKAVENQAENIALDAESKCLEIIENAKIEAKIFKEKNIKDSIDKGNAALDKVKQEEEEKLKNTLVDIDAEIELLKKSVLEKEAKAIEAVKLSLVI